MGYRYIRFYAECGYAGCDGEWYGRFNADISDAELNDLAEEYGRPHCEGYEYIHTDGFDEEAYATEEDAQEALQELSEEYWENCATWGWEEISPEEFYDNVDVIEG
jgi:hypothetical protein